VSGRFDPSFFSSFDVAGDLLFAVPTGQDRKPNNGVVFDLTTGRRVGVLPLTVDFIAVNGDNLAAITPERNDSSQVPRSIPIYRINQAGLSDVAQQQDLITAHDKGMEILARSGSVQDAIDAIEGAVTSPLFNVSALDDGMRAIARDYGSWLAATLDRRAEGIDLLRKLADASPDDPVTRRRLGAALLRNYLLTQNQASLDRVHTLLAENTPESIIGPITRMPPIRSTPIDSAMYSTVIFFQQDKMYLGTWDKDDSASLGVFDRSTLQPLWSIRVRPPDAEQQDAISDITFENGQIMAWLTYRFEEPGRPNLAIIDPNSHRVTLRSVGEHYLLTLQTPKGLVACEHVIGDANCVLNNSNASQATATFYCRLMDLAGSEAADQNALAALVANGCEPFERRDIFALSKKWAIARVNTDREINSVAYLRLQDGADWQNSDMRLSQVDGRIIDDHDSAIIQDRKLKSIRFIRLDMATGSYHTLCQLETTYNSFATWHLIDQILLVARGHDIILYDLENDRLAGVLRNVIAEDFQDNGNGVDKAKIVRVLIDGERLIVLTFDGRYNRVIQMQDVLDFAKASEASFKSVDDLLLK
jgi:hypothetical protein